MFLRTFSPLALLAALAACSQEPASDGAPRKVAGVAVQAELTEAAAAGTIPCALDGAKEFTSKCRIEQVSQGGAVVLVVHHPDGGFHRLIETPDGMGFTAADGADKVVMTANGAEREATVDDDHYLFPAAARNHAAAK